jgi:hypothetical protein
MNNELFEKIYNSLKAKMQFALELHNGNKEAAIAYVKTKTCAGPKVWEKVLSEI